MIESSMRESDFTLKILFSKALYSLRLTTQTCNFTKFHYRQILILTYFTIKFNLLKNSSVLAVTQFVRLAITNEMGAKKKQKQKDIIKL
jgi:hypothetical protein